MGQRIDAAANEVKSVSAAPGAREAIFCPNCGDEDGFTMTRQDDDGNEYTTEIPPSGYAPVAFAETDWIEVDGSLYCSIYCAAKGAGLTEEQAQLARSEKTRMDLREDGRDDLADLDERRVAAIIERPEDFPLAARLQDIADEDDHPHDQTVDATEGAQEEQERFEQIIGGLRRGED